MNRKDYQQKPATTTSKRKWHGKVMNGLELAGLLVAITRAIMGRITAIDTKHHKKLTNKLNVLEIGAMMRLDIIRVKIVLETPVKQMSTPFWRTAR